MTDLGTLILDQFGGPDTDGDGLPDAGEYALGTNPNARDSDGDGLSDDAELTQGLNPNNGRAFPTGIIASLPLRGDARETVIEGLSQSRLALKPSPTLRAPLPPGGPFGFTLTPRDGQSYRIETTTNFQSWLTLTNFPAGPGPWPFLDPAAASFPQRFYRAVAP